MMQKLKILAAVVLAPVWGPILLADKGYRCFQRWLYKPPEGYLLLGNMEPLYVSDLQIAWHAASVTNGPTLAQIYDFLGMEGKHFPEWGYYIKFHIPIGSREWRAKIASLRLEYGDIPCEEG